MICCGAVAGWLSMILCKYLVSVRVNGPLDHLLIRSIYAPIVWCISGVIGFAIIQSLGRGALQITEYITVFLICLCIGAVDFIIRKIPNQLLLTLILSKVVFLALNFSKQEMQQSFLGFAAACVIFTIPSLLKVNVGAGDIKLAVVTGFYLGIYGFLQAMIIMAITIAVYGLYIIIRHRGNLKTKTAMGPYLALGLISTLMFPLF
ncbi:MAG: hypothetical protein A2Y15_09880 [Clostridiales bacterium GWF2_36_10]|nr:MAG: hypothetical protein A2Y15_09880 [Clostridiales bacterium GWF2_36_10]HAN20186.1 hypothetical protein [Clostridiales bacterium]